MDDELNTGSALANMSDADIPMDPSEVVAQDAFLGDTPFETILEGIRSQFNDYVELEDTTDYVDIFYAQMHQSQNLLEADEREEHVVEKQEILDRYHNMFIDFMRTRFEMRLSISITQLEEESLDYDALEVIFRELYTFFILRAKTNFTKVITADTIRALGGQAMDDDQFFQRVQEQMTQYSPLFREINPTEFLRMAGAETIQEMYENNQIAGNFLRRYSPKLYAHPDFEVDLVNTIILTQDIRNVIRNPDET